MFLRNLFFASASILMLAAAYHLGARDVSAQVASLLEGASAGGYQASPSVAVSRIVYWAPGGHVQPADPTPVPGTAPILSTFVANGGGVTVFTADGKVWFDGGYQPSPWYVLADFGVLSAVPAERQTWGRVKLRYR